MTPAPAVSSRATPTCRPGRFLRLAASASVALGALVILALPVLLDAACYVGLLAGTLAGCAVTGGARLWLRDTLLTRAGVALAVAPILVGVLLAFLLGLPGASEVGALSAPGPLGALVLAAAVLALLITDGLRRTPDDRPNRPYAL